jgi:hypothetical protein
MTIALHRWLGKIFQIRKGTSSKCFQFFCGRVVQEKQFLRIGDDSESAFSDTCPRPIQQFVIVAAVVENLSDPYP